MVGGCKWALPSRSPVEIGGLGSMGATVRNRRRGVSVESHEMVDGKQTRTWQQGNRAEP